MFWSSSTVVLASTLWVCKEFFVKNTYEIFLSRYADSYNSGAQTGIRSQLTESTTRIFCQDFCWWNYKVQKAHTERVELTETTIYNCYPRLLILIHENIYVRVGCWNWLNEQHQVFLGERPFGWTECFSAELRMHIDILTVFGSAVSFIHGQLWKSKIHTLYS